ncbi:MAG: hypothetical protein AAFO68_09445 [Pseudomonadota bacterium]
MAKQLCALTALIAVMTVATLGPAAARDCKLYAIQSAKQQKTNETKSCGFSGAGWTKDLKAHEAFCSSVAPTIWRAELTKRQKMLEKCK